MIQSDQAQVYVPDAADRAGAPSMGLTGSYEKKGGAKVVSILRDTRLEFTAGKESLEKQEAQQVADFEASTAAYQKTRATDWPRSCSRRSSRSRSSRAT